MRQALFEFEVKSNLSVSFTDSSPMRRAGRRPSDCVVHGIQAGRLIRTAPTKSPQSGPFLRVEGHPRRSCPFEALSCNGPYEPRATSYEPRTTSHEPRATNHEPRTTNHEPRTTSHEPRTTSHEPRATNHEPRTTSHEPRATNLPCNGIRRGRPRGRPATR